jgi:glycerol-3-phosphate acyltransferase PlsX
LVSQDPHPVIAVDAMGGDYAPGNVVAGSLDALRESGGRFSLVLVGQRERIEEEIAGAHPSPPGYTIAHAPEVIDMRDSPTAALRSKKESSIAIGLRLQRDGKADAFVSAGNTGAVLSASTLILGRLDGVGRPSIGALIPTAGSPCLLIDSGATMDCQPRHLYEFGVMGSIYMRTMRGVSTPRVGLVSVGEEENKGNEATVEAFRLLKGAPVDFIGMIEGRDLLKGKVDVAVCDGFVGNIVLKFGESVPAFLKARFLSFAAKSVKAKLIALIARSGLRTVLREMDYQEQGGVPVLGVRGVTIIGHGGSSPLAIKNMIFRAEEMVKRHVHRKIQEALQA